MNERKSVFICTDLEGISGVDHIDMVMKTEEDGYRRACELLMQDTNAAVAGAFDGGADAVYVLDGHGGGKNFIPGMLDPRAVQVKMDDMPKLMKECGATMQIGLHAMSGTMNAFLDHTQSSVSVHDYYFNDMKIGELMQDGVYSGAFGVPCVTVSGDKAACAEAEHFFPGVYTACVKTAKERNIADCLPPEEGARLIYEAAKAGFMHRAEIKPYVLPTPYTVTIEFNRADYCDDVCRWRKDVERLDARTVRSRKTKTETYWDVLL
ncbi:MAG: M55 family metallopeptidase [Clostridia bacterium]|nr:M55 family metallopeptidase [Clostridia bacterium]